MRSATEQLDLVYRKPAAVRPGNVGQHWHDETFPVSSLNPASAADSKHRTSRITARACVIGVDVVDPQSDSGTAYRGIGVSAASNGDPVRMGVRPARIRSGRCPWSGELNLRKAHRKNRQRHRRNGRAAGHAREVSPMCTGVPRDSSMYVPDAKPIESGFHTRQGGKRLVRKMRKGITQVMHVSADHGSQRARTAVRRPYRVREVEICRRAQIRSAYRAGCPYATLVQEFGINRIKHARKTPIVRLGSQA